MPLLLLLLFIGVPILEIAVFIQAGDLIGLWPTIAVVIGTGIAGTIMMRIQGFGVIRRIREQTDQGQAPVFELFEGLCLFAAGLLLLTPGFVTDSLGFLLFLPPLRKLIAHWIASRIRFQTSGSFHFSTGGGPRGPRAGPGAPGAGGDVIDGEYETVEPDRERLSR